MYYTIPLALDGSERLTYNSSDLPLRAVKGDLSHFADYAANCHWHNDFEILLADQEDIDYFVNGSIIHIQEGEAIFVNANRLHYGFSAKKQECLYTCLVFHPSLFGGEDQAAFQHAAELGDDAQPDHLLLRDRDTLDLIRRIYNVCTPGNALCLLEARGLCFQLLALLCRAAADNRPSMEPTWSALRQMVGYIQNHYNGHVLLADIAAAGAVCRSKCCRLFQNNLHTTPIEYLNHYRLEKARELLLTTRLPITEIAQHCGFRSPSYFSESYRKIYGVSPRTTRQKL